MWNLESGTQNPEPGILNPESEVQNLESDFNFRFPVLVSDFGFGHGPLASRCLVAGFRFPSGLVPKHCFSLVLTKVLVQKQFPAGLLCDCPASARIPVHGFRFRFGPAPLASNHLVSVSGQTFVPLPGSSLDFGLQFPLSDSGFDVFRYFSMSGFQFLAVLSCDCPAPAGISVSGFGFQFGLAPLAPRAI